MSDHLKILDGGRKGLLTLPPSALKLWLCYYMAEDEERESYMSKEAEIPQQTGMSVPTVIKWSKWLVRHGWLTDTGKTAYDKLLARGIVPSANSKQVIAYKVDDPTPKHSLEVPHKNLKGYTPKKSLDKVSCSGYGSGSTSGSSSISNSSSGSGSDYDVEQSPQNENEGRTENHQTENLKPENPTLHGPSLPKKMFADGTPIPPNFDALKNEERLALVKEHGRMLKKGETPTACGVRRNGQDEKADGARAHAPKIAALPPGSDANRQMTCKDFNGGTCLGCNKLPMVDPTIYCQSCLQKHMEEVLCGDCGQQRRRLWNADFCEDCWQRRQSGGKLKRHAPALRSVAPV